MKKIVLDNSELEYSIFQSVNKESGININGTKNNIVLIHGGIIADANIPLVTFSDTLTKSYNVLHYHRCGYGKSINKKMIIQIYYSMWKIAEEYWIFLILRKLI